MRKKDLYNKLKLLLILILSIFILGCQQIKTSPDLESLGDIIPSEDEVKNLGIEINITQDFIYTAEDYYSEYPFLKHSKGFQGSFIRRYYFYQIGKDNYLNIDVTIFDSFKSAKKSYEKEIDSLKEIHKIFNITREENNLYSLGNISTILEDKGKAGDKRSREARGHTIYYVKDNYLIKVNTVLLPETKVENGEVIVIGQTISLEKLIEIAKIVESRI